jgi:hypothetical protein
MYRLLAFLSLLLGSLASFSAAACHRISPDPKSLDQYSAVFLGAVTGIHLDGYESRLLGKPDGVIDAQAIILTDGSSPMSVTTVATQSVRGASKTALTLRLVGCTNSLPALRERGLFFVNPDGVSAVTAWESNPQEFAYWLQQLGIQSDGR